MTTEDIAFIPVESSWLRGYFYDEETERLYVNFKGVVCYYEDVPQEMWEGLQAAESKGVYVHESGLYAWPYTVLD